MNTNIEDVFKNSSKPNVSSRPIIFNVSAPEELAALNKLYVEGLARHIIDDYEEQQREYFQIQNPTQVFASNFEEQFTAHLAKLREQMPLRRHGRWAYFPWISTLAHILEDESFQSVRMARNRNLITKEEQEKFYNSTVGVAGLSIGNSVALAIVLQGGAKRIRLADHDRLALSNLNRIRSGVDNLGVLKVEMTARQIYLLNPYAEVELFPDGLNKENIERFFGGPPALDVVVDEIDNLAVKYLIREQAQKHKIAVVMGADNGDNAVIDIERYDKNSAQEFFHGRIGRVTYDELAKLDKIGTGKKIVQHIGIETVTEQAHSSFMEIGKTLVSWPQLGGVALLNGCAIAYCVRKILNKQPLEPNRALISLDEKLIPNYNSPKEIKKRDKVSNEFKKFLNYK